jgi:prolyl-tRNA synthetase
MKARDMEEKISVPLESIVETVKSELETMQTRLFEKAKAFRAQNSHTHIDTMEQLEKHIVESQKNESIPGWVLAGWCGDDACEASVKENTKFTTRNIPFNPPAAKHKCINCGTEAKHTVWFARAY